MISFCNALSTVQAHKNEPSLVNKLAKSLLKNCGKSMQELTVSIKYFPDIFEQWDDYATF